jgi:hypothetical protein
VIFGCFFKAHDLTDFLAGVFIVTVMTALLIYIIKHWREQGVDLAISLKGVYLDGKGLYPWSLIESFSTTEDHNDRITTKLILHFSQYEDEDFDITHVAISRGELVEHLLYYKGIYSTYYKGHRKI